MVVLDIAVIALALLVAVPGSHWLVAALATRRGIDPVAPRGAAALPSLAPGDLFQRAAQQKRQVAGTREQAREAMQAGLSRTSAACGVLIGLGVPVTVSLLTQSCGPVVSVTALPLIAVLVVTVPAYLRQIDEQSEIARARVAYRGGLASGLVVTTALLGGWCFFLAAAPAA